MRYHIIVSSRLCFDEYLDAKNLKDAKRKAKNLIGENMGYEETPLPQDNYLIDTIESVEVVEECTHDDFCIQ